jgi:hypothetical protein
LVCARAGGWYSFHIRFGILILRSMPAVRFDGWV